MSDFNALQTLQDRGLIPASPASHHGGDHKANNARQVLSTLTESEVDILSSIRDRMTANGGPDVEAHLVDVTGTVFW